MDLSYKLILGLINLVAIFQIRLEHSIFPLLLCLVIKDFKTSPIPDTSEATMLWHEGEAYTHCGLLKIQVW